MATTKSPENTSSIYHEDDFLFINHHVLMDSLTPSLIYMIVLLIFGIPGNITVLYIYIVKCRPSTTRIFIMALAFLDIVHCTFIMPIEIALLVNFDSFDYPVLCKISRFFSSVINNSSAFILIAIAIDRFKRICRPHGHLVEPNIAKKLVGSALIFAIITSWQMCMLYGTRTLKHGKTCLISDHMHGKIFPTIYVYVLVVGQAITDMLLIIFYSLVGREVCIRKAQRRHRRSLRMSTEISQMRNSLDFSDETPSPNSSSEPSSRFSFIFRRETSNESSSKSAELARSISRQSRGSSIRRQVLSKTTIMMFLVTVTFILSFVPHTVAVIIRYQAKTIVQSLTVSGMTTYQLCLRSYFMNSVLNPFIYCFVSKQFRNQFKESLQWCKKQGNVKL
ncbi:cholecystokinin receptor type A-like [Mytilus galloprovincialis]|uniref:cholecystokinin receptor type A-like n=1 Tax=Mytilus galloprovincialis TaxID=29158 RepID=UPI003F7CBA39